MSVSSAATPASVRAPILPPEVAPGRDVVLLGAQRHKTTVNRAMRRIGLSGHVATVTAGWQEREEELDELQAEVGSDSVNLRLHERAEEIFKKDTELAQLHRRRQETLQDLQELYDVRLGYALEAVKELERRKEPASVIRRERQEAMAAVRELDRRHEERVAEVHAEWDAQLAFSTRPSIDPHRKEIAEVLSGVDGLTIAGGHVAVLLNRMRMFDVLGALGPKKPIVAWSGGAMVLTERVVFYHDHPPQGPGNAEVFEIGLGVVKNLVALPLPRRRLQLDDPDRVSRFARRFHPASCVALEEGAALSLSGKAFSADAGVKRLNPDGTVTKLESA